MLWITFDTGAELCGVRHRVVCAAWPLIPKPLTANCSCISTVINYLGIEASARANVVMFVQVIILVTMVMVTAQAWGCGAHLSLSLPIRRGCRRA